MDISSVARKALERWSNEPKFVPARLLLQTIQQAGEVPTIRVHKNPGGWPVIEYGISSHSLTTEHRFHQSIDLNVIFEHVTSQQSALEKFLNELLKEEQSE